MLKEQAKMGHKLWPKNDHSKTRQSGFPMLTVLISYSNGEKIITNMASQIEDRTFVCSWTLIVHITIQSNFRNIQNRDKFASRFSVKTFEYRTRQYRF
jgi:hypothetical protein